MKKVLLLAALAAGLIGVSAAQASRPSAHQANARVVGFAPAHHYVHSAAGRAAGTGQLLYHNGPVMHTNTTYAIYWEPPGYGMQVGYSSLIDQFFTDVAAASGQTTNVYYTATQYSDGAGNVQYSSTFGGSYMDTTPLPASGCTDSYTPVCLADWQLRAELQKDIAANGWPVGQTSDFFLFLPKKVGSCYRGSCAFSGFCGYHGVIGTGSTEILWANMPYADTARTRCDGGQHPNANNADATISIASHEQNETITDPRWNGWYDSSGDETGDKCAWRFGPLTGPAGAQYNQTINGHNYFLQEEYSNLQAGCVQSGL